MSLILSVLTGRHVLTGPLKRLRLSVSTFFAADVHLVTSVATNIPALAVPVGFPPDLGVVSAMAGVVSVQAARALHPPAFPISRGTLQLFTSSEFVNDQSFGVS